MANLPLIKRPRVFRMVETVPELELFPRRIKLREDLDEDGTEDEGGGFWDWLNSDAGQKLTSTAAQIAAQKAGSPIVYPVGTGTYTPSRAYQSSASLSPVLLYGGLALVAFLMLKKR